MSKQYPYEKCSQDKIILVDCVSDLHGFSPSLPGGGDLLIIAGDLTARDEYEEYVAFKEWLRKQRYSKVILIGGNHDRWIENHQMLDDFFPNTEYLCDSGTIFEGIRLWGSPWTAYFDGMNPKCTAFTLNFGCDTDQWLADKWAMIPEETDILITHSPPYGALDKTSREKIHVGSRSLRDRVELIRPLYHVFGHIHEGYGIVTNNNTVFINCSYVNEKYNKTRKPVRIEF